MHPQALRLKLLKRNLVGGGGLQLGRCWKDDWEIDENAQFAAEADVDVKLAT
jgi:hypothetical protein